MFMTAQNPKILTTSLFLTPKQSMLVLIIFSVTSNVSIDVSLFDNNFFFPKVAKNTAKTIIDAICLAVI